MNTKNVQKKTQCANIFFNPIGAGGAESAHTIFKRLFLHEKGVLEFPNFVTFPNSVITFRKYKKIWFFTVFLGDLECTQ